MGGSFEELCEVMLGYLWAGVPKQPVVMGPVVPLMWFDGVEPYIGLEWVPEGMRDEEGFVFFNPEVEEVKLSDLSGRMDVGFITEVKGDGSGYKLMRGESRSSPKMGLVRCREVDLSEVRGRFRVMGRVVEYSWAMMYLGCEYMSGKSWAQRVGGKWRVWLNREWVLEDEWDINIKMSISMAFTRRYFWRVLIGYEGSPGISFSTDPSGVREVFRLRDIPEGRGRREALRHWVRDHWRRVRKDTGDTAHVRRHLRGAERFVWNGMRCEIYPSDFDVDQLARG